MHPAMHRPHPRLLTRLALGLAVITAACGDGNPGDASEVVATAGDAALTRGDLTSLLTRSPIPPTEGLAFGLTSAWIDHALTIQHLDALDSDRIFEAATVQAHLDSLVQRLIASRRLAARAATQEEVDSIGRRGDIHVYRMYAIGLPPGDSSAQASGAGILLGLRSAALAASTSPAEQMANLSESDRKKIVTTDFPATNQAGIPAGLASQIWDLREGEISMPLRNQDLLQMYYRVPRPAANSALAEWTRLAVQARTDSLMIDSLTTARKFSVPDDIAARMRGAFNEPGTISGTGAIASWDDGETTPDEAMAWIRTMPAPVRAERITASDNELVRLAQAAGRRELLAELVKNVDTAGLEAAIRSVYTAQVNDLRSDAKQVALGATPSERAFAWSTAETLIKVPYRSEPSGLGAALRALTPVDVDAVRVRGALGEAVRVWQAPDATPGVPAVP